MPPTSSNYITFTPDPPIAGASGSLGNSSGSGDSGGTDNSWGVMIFLTMEGPFVLSATAGHGLEPNINRAIVPYTQWEKYPQLPGAVGTVKFWSHWDKTDKLPGCDDIPDHAITGVRVVDVEAITIGEVCGLSGVRIIEYRIYLADKRERWVDPRGGRLALGLVNPDPLPANGVLQFNSQLMRQCLTAMAQSETTVLPVGIDLLPPPRDLDWLGNHAPTELRNLLEWTGSTLCLLANGQVAILNPGQGAMPTIPAGDLVYNLDLPVVNRRGDAVILCSYPNAVIQTIELDGPSASTWEYVIREGDGPWRPISDMTIDPVSIVKKPLQDIVALENLKIHNANYRRVWEELYRHIRLSKTASESPLLRKLVDGSKSLGPPQFKARIAVLGPNGWANSTNYIDLRPVNLIDGNVVQFSQRLGKIAAGGTDPDMNFEPLAEGDLVSTISLEAWKDGKPEYFMIGFRKDPAPVDGSDGLVQMNDSEVQLALERSGGSGSDLMIIPAPELRLYRWGDAGDTNEDQLALQARELAKVYLAGSGQKKRIIRAVGFHAVELSGLVSEIKWDQAELITEITINSWWSPLSKGVSEHFRKLIGSEKYPQQSKTQNERSANGETGTVQPTVPLGAPPTYADKFMRVRIKSIQNDTLTCRTWNGANEGDADVVVLKPRELRHVLAHYPQLTALTTGNAQTVTAVSGSTSETWKVTPDYVADGEIAAALTAEGWVDANFAGRAWAVEAS